MPTPGLDQPKSATGDLRIAALDGVRGFMTILVLFSHFFAEIDNGFPRLGFGWLAVNMFFVLSGFLIGRLIIERMDSENFFTVFVMRRICRTIPSYIVSVLIIFAVLWIFRTEPWTKFKIEFPLWSYLSFSQNIFMGMTNDVGVYWLAPTWTLALEEQLYVLLPFVFFLAPRRYWLRILIGVALAAVALRAMLFTSNVAPIWGLVVLPTRGDVLVVGVIAAIIFKDKNIDLSRYDFALRCAPVVLMFAAVLITLIDPVERVLFNVFGPLLVSAGFACLLVAMVRGAPEAKRFESKFFCFFGHISYCVYLTHLMVLGLMHGLILGAKPSLGSVEQWLVTVTGLFVAVGVGWALTTLIEAPLTAYGRSWKWSAKKTASGGQLQALSS
ncbi:acyltransferase family protein [Bradyrhizobium sp. SYSU BS000235]|uniref:acyltransferase family protein n=1 Tax=Bradyrhizobium sp. SYSU BS000235 TaxID=3411332 RepID=UPI003C7942EE